MSILLILHAMPEKSDPKPINRWMKFSKMAVQPHFAVRQDADGTYHTACGRIHTKDLIAATQEEIKLIEEKGKFACCAVCYLTYYRLTQLKK